MILRILVSMLFVCLSFTDSVIPLSKKNLNLDSGLTNQQYARGTYLIILANANFYAFLNYQSYDFIEFKKSQGYDVEVFSYREGNDNVEGINANDQNELKDFLIEYYNNNPMLEYVLLVGDVNQSLDEYNIPTFTIESYNPPIVNDQTDHPYTFWGDNGDDEAYSPKFFIGRWSISEQQDILKLMMRSINYYTLNSLFGEIDASYLNKALMVAGNYNGNAEQPETWPVTPVWTTKWLMEELFDYGYEQIDTALFHTGNYEIAEINPQIENSFNDGIGIINYRGWGDATGWHKPKFHLDDIGELNGNDKLPVVFSFVCNTGDFGNETQSFCFGEEIITAGSLFNQKGAVAMVGPSDLDTDTRFNNVICGALWDGLLEHKVNELAPALHYGKSAVLNEFKDLGEIGLNPTNIPFFYHHVYVVLGDPSLSVWLQEPSIMTSEFDTNTSLNKSYISSVISDSDGVPLMDVVGVAMKDGEIVGKGLSNQEGFLDIDLSNLNVGDTFSLFLNKSQFRQKEYEIVFSEDDGSVLNYNSYINPISNDDYGYVFIHSSTNHELAPEYDWIEINEVGTNLELTDDSHTIINIGFDFQFYGETFDEITIGSNGWASFLPCLNGDGLAPDCEVIDHFFNNSITFPIGPYGLLAPFYDDLDDNVGQEPFNVYSYLDDQNRFIVEWDDIANGENDDLCPDNCDRETFQMILYDPNYYQTPTGDGEIVFQYKEFNNVDEHGVTIGIESPDKNQGVQYLFHETYHPGAVNLDDGNIAIKFLVTDQILDNDVVELPSSFNIKSAYPNPFNPSINIELSIDLNTDTNLSIIDINGRIVENLHSGVLVAGEHSFVWSPSHDVSSGLYFVKFDNVSKGISESKKITLIK
tara:strand:- start:581 stop:3187 length:2607 start_codon:yes stop_codon:yes gene_type:complete